MRNSISLSDFSKKLEELKIFHKVVNNSIVTRRSKTMIPPMNEDIAYLIGVITGDGTIIKSKRNRGGFHYILKITSDSENCLEYLNYLFNLHFGIQGRIVRDERKNHTYNLVIQNAAVFWYFVLSGLSIGKKIRIKVPVLIKTKKLKLNYLAGLVDTDGHVKYKRIQLKQKDRLFLKELYTILNRFNMNCNKPKVNYTDLKPFYYIRFDNKLPLRTPQ